MKKEPLISEDNVWSVLEFAQSLYGNYTGYYTPQLLHENVVSLNNNPRTPTYQKIKDALANAKYQAKDLQGYSEFMEVWDSIYSRTIDYYAGMLSFDLKHECTNAWGNDYNTKEYKDDIKRINKFLDNFNYRDEFQKMVKEMLRRETVFTWLRDSRGTFEEIPIDIDNNVKEGKRNYKVKKDSDYALQILPQEYCTLTGYFGKGILASFDMTYFLQPSSDILLFDPSLMPKYLELFDAKENPIIPSAQLKDIRGEFATQIMLSPNDGQWTFKFDTSNFNSVPPLAHLMKNTFNNTEIAEMQYNKDIASAYAMIVGEMGTQDTKSGNTPNQFKVTPDVLGALMQMVANGLKKNVKAVAVPTENTEFMQFNETNALMSQNQVMNTASQGVSASRLIYSTDKMSQSEIENCIITDYNFMKRLYEQFNNFLNFYVNKKTKRFKFKFKFDGSSYPFEQQNRRKAIGELADRGITLSPSAWASAYGIEPMSFDRMIDEAKNGDFADKLMLLLNTNTSKDGSGENGAPKKDSSDLKDSGASSRDYS